MRREIHKKSYYTYFIVYPFPNFRPKKKKINIKKDKFPLGFTPKIPSNNINIGAETRSMEPLVIVLFVGCR